MNGESTHSRLRATTRSQEGGTGSCSMSPRAKAKRMKMAKMYSRSGSAASKRLFSGAPRGTELVKDEPVSEDGVNVKSSRAILETLVNNCNMYLHPKVTRKILL